MTHDEIERMARDCMSREVFTRTPSLAGYHHRKGPLEPEEQEMASWILRHLPVVRAAEEIRDTNGWVSPKDLCAAVDAARQEAPRG